MSKLVKESEVQMTAIRAQGAGGQHVNKVSSAIHLRFDIESSGLDEDHKARLKALPDRRINAQGVIVLKSQGTRSQDMNRMFAWSRLDELVQAFGKEPKIRRATKVKKSSIEKRLKEKKKRSVLKSSRGLVVA